MRNVIAGGQFRRDVKLTGKRGNDMSKLREAVLLLAAAIPLPPRYHDHPLRGNWARHRDCHIEPDWLLQYKIDGDNLYMVRTGTHADLF
ncbi:MAG: type II toxin-antitoxin system YafQ family toxin [Bryobacteraceae bacterium]